MTGDSTILMLAATLTGAIAFAYLTVIESRRTRQLAAEREAYLAGIEHGTLLRRCFPLAPAPKPPDELPAFNAHLPRHRRRVNAAECRQACYADGVFVGFWREELADLDALPTARGSVVR